MIFCSVGEGVSVRSAFGYGVHDQHLGSLLASDSLFELKRPSDQMDDVSLSERDAMFLRYIIQSFSKTNMYSNPEVLESIKRLNGYLEGQKSGIRVSLKEAVVTLPEGEKKRNIPVILVPLPGLHDIYYYVLGAGPVIPLDQVGVLGLNTKNLVHMPDEGLGWVGKMVVEKPPKYPDIMKQTVNNPLKKEVSSKLIVAAGELLLKQEAPSYWGKKYFGEFGAAPPAYDLVKNKDKSWDALVYDLLLKQEGEGIEVTNVKYAKAGIKKLQLKLYSVAVPWEQGGIIQPDGRRVLIYPHLYLEKDELELYVPEFILDEQKMKKLFEKHRIKNISVVHILAQLIDQAIGDEYFGFPEIWMDADASRLNANDFIAVSEAKLCELFLAKERGDLGYLDGFNAALGIMKEARLSGVTDQKVLNRVDLLANEINLLWNDKLLLPTTMRSFELKEKSLSNAEFADLVHDPLYARIQEVSRIEHPDEEVISGLILAIFKRIEEEFGSSGILNDIRKYARLCYASYRRKRYEATVNYWGRLQNKMYLLKSPALNLDAEMVDRVQRSINIALFELLSEHLDRYFAHYVQINGISSLEPIVDKSYIVSGQVRVVKNKAEFIKMCDNAKPWEIIVIDHMPDADRPMKKVSGIITAHFSALQSHEATRARAMQIPAASLAHADKLLQFLDGAWVQFSVVGRNASLVPFADISKIEEAKARSIGRDTARKIDVPPADISTRKNYIHGYGTIRTNEAVGNKGFKLAVLKRNMESAGVHVPDADFIPFAAYHRFLESNPALKSFMADTLKSIEKKESDQINQGLNAIRQKIVEAPIPKDMEAEIVRGLTDGVYGTGGGRFAVRSSMNIEDLEDEACAGFYDSYLNIRTIEGIMTHIKKVWASIWNRMPYNFREVHQISHDVVFPAVIIQKMVSAEYSFVIFTANIAGDADRRTDQVMIEMVPGMGESLVGSGEEYPGRPMRFVYDKKKDDMVSCDFGDRRIKVVPDKDGEGLVKTPAFVFTGATFEKEFGMGVRDFVRMLGSKSVVAENIAERPQDIEGTITREPVSGKDRVLVTFTQTRGLAGYSYYPVTDEMVRKRYGKWIDELFREAEPVIDKPYSIDQRDVMHDLFQYPFSEMAADAERYRLPLLKYIFNYNNSGPKVLARCLWYPMSDTHHPTFMVLRGMPPGMLAAIYTHLCVDADNPFIEVDQEMIMSILEKAKTEYFGENRPPRWYRNMYVRLSQRSAAGALQIGDKTGNRILKELQHDKSSGQKRVFIELFNRRISDVRKKRFGGLNGYFISRSLLGWDRDYVLSVLKMLRAEKLAMVVKELSQYYRILGGDVAGNQISENGMKDIVVTALTGRNQSEVRRFVRSLNDETKEWLVMRASLPEGFPTQIETASTVIISDGFADRVRISKLFEDPNIKQKLPVDFISNSNINQEMVLHDIAQIIKPSVIVLNARSGEAVREFLIWLHQSGIKADVILVVEPGTELPASYFTEYQVKKMVERDTNFDRRIFDAVVEIINEIIKAQQDAVEPVPKPVKDAVNQSIESVKMVEAQL
jgi:hypothetical protein